MILMPQSREERERAIGIVQLGAHVARILNCTKLTITRLIQCYRVTGRTADRPRSGKPHINSQQGPPSPHHNSQQGPPSPHHNSQQGPPSPHHNSQQGPPSPHHNSQQWPPSPHHNSQQGPPSPHHNSQQGPPSPHLTPHLQRLALNMSSAITLYIVNYDSMLSGPINHSEGWRWWGKIIVFVGHVNFNIGTGNMYSFLMRAGSSYSELMAGLGYTNVQEREQLCAVFRRLYHLVVDLWWFGVVSVANSGQTLL